MPITDAEIDKIYDRLRKLSNSARYAEAHQLAIRSLRQHPHVIQFAYYEAVMTAEDDINFTPAQTRARYKKAARKLKTLLKRLRNSPPILRARIRNEYYWFSRQPHKQYLLGVELVSQGQKRFYYSQGVGAAEVAKLYAKKGKRSLFLRWAKRSEKAWLRFFKEDANWYNSYFFYAMSLGFQGRKAEMEKALARAARIAGKPKNWLAIRKLRREIEETDRLFGRD